RNNIKNYKRLTSISARSALVRRWLAVCRSIFQRDVIAFTGLTALRVIFQNKPTHHEHCCECQKQDVGHAIPLVLAHCRVPRYIPPRECSIAGSSLAAKSSPPNGPDLDLQKISTLPD